MTEIFSDIIIIDKKEFQDWTDNDKIDIDEIIEFDNKMLIKFKAESSLACVASNKIFMVEIHSYEVTTAIVNIALAAAVTAYAIIH